MGVKRLRRLAGGVLAATATVGVAAAYGGTVPASPDVSTVKAPLEFEQSASPAPDTNSKATESNGNTGVKETASRTFQTPAEGELLWMPDPHSSDPVGWSPGFASGSMSSGSSPDGLVFSTAPDQVLIPLPSAAWTGLTGLAALGVVGLMKHARRFLR